MIPEFLPGRRARAPRHLPRVHGRRSLGGRRRSPRDAGARRARRRVPARVPPRRRDRRGPRDALLRHAPPRRRQGHRRHRAQRSAAPTWRGAILARLGFSPEDVEEACHLIQQAPRDVPRGHAPRSRRSRHHRRVLARGARPRGPPRSLPAHRRRSLHHQPHLDDLLEGAACSTSSTSPPTPRSRGRGRRQRHGRRSTPQAVAQEVARVAEAHPGGERGRRAPLRRAFVASYLASMPERYVLANAPHAIAAHAELARRHASGADAVSVALVPSRHPEAAELCVVASTGPASSPPSPRPSPPPGSRSTPRRFTRASSAGGVQAVDLFWVRDRGDGAAGRRPGAPQARPRHRPRSSPATSTRPSWPGTAAA